MELEVKFRILVITLVEHSFIFMNIYKKLNLELGCFKYKILKNKITQHNKQNIK